MRSKTKQLKAISFFTGAGGLDLGFEAAGVDVRLAVDIMPESCLTLRYNAPEKIVIGPPSSSGDLYEITAPEILDQSGLKKGEIDIVIGGPPCQPFSVAAAQRFLKSDKKFKRKGFDCNEKGQLIFRYAELIATLLPKAFLIENVPGILSIDGGSGIKIVYHMLTKAGYTLSEPFVLDAKDFGAPQNRRRAFVIGTLSGKKITAPTPTHGSKQTFFTKEFTTVSQALFGMPEDLPNNEIRDHKESSLKRYKTLRYGEREPLGRVDRLDPLKPSKTVIAGGSGGGGRSHLHPYQARTMSVRECARLQTFPDSYIFLGKNGRQFTQVGNAVPPLLAEVLARAILEAEFGKTFQDRLVHSIEAPDPEQAAKSVLAQSKRDHSSLLYNDLAKQPMNQKFHSIHDSIANRSGYGQRTMCPPRQGFSTPKNRVPTRP